MNSRPEYLRNAPFGTTGVIYVAVKLAAKYSHRLPTVEELRSEFGMCRATAYRWLRAMKDARGEA